MAGLRNTYPFIGSCPPFDTTKKYEFDYCKLGGVECTLCPTVPGDYTTTTVKDPQGNPIFCNLNDDIGVVCNGYSGGSCTIDFGSESFVCSNGATLGGFPGDFYGVSQNGHCTVQGTFTTSDGYKLDYCKGGNNCYLCKNSSGGTDVTTPGGQSVSCTIGGNTVTCPGTSGSCTISPGETKFSCDSTPPPPPHSQLYACDGSGNCVPSSTGVADPKCGKGCWTCDAPSLGVSLQSSSSSPPHCKKCVAFFQKRV